MLVRFHWIFIHRVNVSKTFNNKYKELYMIRAKNGPLANIDDFFPVGRVSGNMFIYT